MVAEGKVDTFMSEVLLPLAAETHAVVICNAIPGSCILSASFLRMYSAKRATWGEKNPFTILSVTNDLDAIYTNPSLDSYWREVSRKSRSWMLREQRIIQVLTTSYQDKRDWLQVVARCSFTPVEMPFPAREYGDCGSI